MAVDELMLLGPVSLTVSRRGYKQLNTYLSSFPCLLLSPLVGNLLSQLFSTDAETDDENAGHGRTIVLLVTVAYLGFLDFSRCLVGCAIGFKFASYALLKW
jgi:hypothetical protein